jgi:hypothetical protein
VQALACPGRLAAVRAANRTLESVQAQLASYLAAKRAAFPRFHFISDGSRSRPPRLRAPRSTSPRSSVPRASPCCWGVRSRPAGHPKVRSACHSSRACAYGVCILRVPDVFWHREWRERI